MKARSWCGIGAVLALCLVGCRVRGHQHEWVWRYGLTETKGTEMESRDYYACADYDKQTCHEWMNVYINCYTDAADTSYYSKGFAPAPEERTSVEVHDHPGCP